MNVLLSKLYTILVANNMSPVCLLMYESNIIYIEVLVGHEHFIIHIPDVYTVIINKDDIVTFDVQQIDIRENGNIIDDYGGELNDYEIEQDYNGTGFDVHIPDDVDVIDRVEQSYNCQIALQDIHITDKTEILSIIRQLRRLYLCVKHTEYNMCILFKQYVCSVQPNNVYNVYKIDKPESCHSNKRFLLHINMDVFIDNAEHIYADITAIHKGVYDILDKNQQKHTQHIYNMLQMKNYINTCSSDIMVRKQKWDVQMAQLHQLLDKLHVLKKALTDDRYVLKNKHTDTTIRGLHADIADTHAVSKIDNELTEIHHVKREIEDNIFLIKHKKESLVLNVDTICFENTIMINEVNKKFKQFICI